MMDIDKLIHQYAYQTAMASFSSMMDIDKLISHLKPNIKIL